MGYNGLYTIYQRYHKYPNITKKLISANVQDFSSDGSFILILLGIERYVCTYFPFLKNNNNEIVENTSPLYYIQNKVNKQWIKFSNVRKVLVKSGAMAIITADWDLYVFGQNAYGVGLAINTSYYYEQYQNQDEGDDEGDDEYFQTQREEFEEAPVLNGKAFDVSFGSLGIVILR